jgi:hypothetical protein
VIDVACHLCVPKIRFCNIGDEVRRGQVAKRLCARVMQKVEALGAMRWLALLFKVAVFLILRLNSLFAPKNSLLGLQKFPVPLRREFDWKPLNSLADWTSKSQRKA